jgi:hypothetical protein
MRDALNSNPLVQAAVIAVLLIGTAFFVLSSSGGGKKSSAGDSESAAQSVEARTVPAAGSEASPSGPGTADAIANLAASAAPRLPRAVVDAYRADRTIVLVVVHDGGIDDRLVGRATAGLAGFRDAAVFIVPARQISRYAAITEGVGVDRVPALIVVRPRRLDGKTPTASVSYGFQSPESIAQAVIDAGYEGPTIDYHP